MEEKMTKITIPASVTEIGASAFSGCIQLSSITIPPNVTKIGNSAFAFCEKIDDIQIPVSMTEIGGGAFSHTNIQSITIPKNVIAIGNAVFKGCQRLSTILVDDENEAFRVEENCLILKSGNEIIAGCKTSIIPASAESIATVAFSRIPIISIDIPATIKKVGGFAFQEWTSIQTIRIMGFENREEACAVWGTNWWYGNAANIIYLGI